MELTFWREDSSSLKLGLQYDKIRGIRLCRRLMKQHEKDYLTAEGFHDKKDEYLLIYKKNFKSESEIKQFINNFEGKIYAIKDFGDGKIVLVKS